MPTIENLDHYKMASIDDPTTWLAYGKIDPELGEVCGSDVSYTEKHD